MWNTMDWTTLDDLVLDMSAILVVFGLIMIWVMAVNRRDARRGRVPEPGPLPPMPTPQPEPPSPRPPTPNPPTEPPSPPLPGQPT